MLKRKHIEKCSKTRELHDSMHFLLTAGLIAAFIRVAVPVSRLRSVVFSSYVPMLRDIPVHPYNNIYVCMCKSIYIYYIESSSPQQ